MRPKTLELGCSRPISISDGGQMAPSFERARGFGQLVKLARCNPRLNEGGTINAYF